MNNYKIILPENYTQEHINIVEQVKTSIQVLSSQTENILGIKDVNSRHIIATNAYAKIVGLKHGTEVAGKLESEMPCFGIAQFVNKFVEEDRDLINKLDIHKSITTLNIHQYSDGLKARKFIKSILHHEESKSILGIVYSGYDIDIKDFIQFFPNYYTLLESINTKKNQLKRLQTKFIFLMIMSKKFAR